MFRKILFPVYGNELDDKDFNIIVDLAEKYSGEIFLLTVSEIYHTGLSDLNVPEELFEQHKELLNNYLLKIAEKFSSKGLKVHTAVKEGIPYREIVDYADEIKAVLSYIESYVPEVKEEVVAAVDGAVASEGMSSTTLLLIATLVLLALIFTLTSVKNTLKSALDQPTESVLESINKFCNAYMANSAAMLITTFVVVILVLKVA